MKTCQLLAALAGAASLAFASPNASASVASGSFRVSLTLAAPCEVSTQSARDPQPVAVRCQTASTPYQVQLADNAREQPASGFAIAAPVRNDGFAVATVTF